MSSGSKVFVARLPHQTTEEDLEQLFSGYGQLGDVVLKMGYAFVYFDNASDADAAVSELDGEELHGESIVVEYAKPGGGGRGGRRGGGGRYDDDGRRGGGRSGGGGYGDEGRRYRDDESGGGGRFRGGGRGGRGGGAGGGRFGPPQRTEYKLRIENLSARTSWQDLKDHMRSAGIEVPYADAHRFRSGEGVVHCTTASDMKRAMDELDGSDMDGRSIRIRKIENRQRGDEY